MRLSTKEAPQFALHHVAGALQSSSTKFRLFAMLLHCITCVAFLVFIPQPASERFGAVAPFVKPFLLSLITFAMPWIYLFATHGSDAFGQGFTNAMVDYTSQLYDADPQSFDASEKSDFFKQTRIELILFPTISLVTGFLFITLLVWKLGAPILLSLLAIFLLDGVAYFAFYKRALAKLNPQTEPLNK